MKVDLGTADPTTRRWIAELSTFGHLMASLPNVDIREPAPRMFLSVPTGQYVPWIIANGALLADPKLGRDPMPGDRVTVILGAEIVDATVETSDDGGWVVASGLTKKAGAPDTRPPGVVLPETAPLARPTFKPNQTFVEGLKKAGAALPRAWYSDQSLSPVVMVGDGREFLNNQRQEIIGKAPQWFEITSQTLLSVEHGGTTDPERMLQFPYMILAPEVATHSPWIAGLTPRLVIYTRWSYFLRALASGLFSRSPAVIIGNRRVESNYAGLEFIDSAGCDNSAFGDTQIPTFQNAIYMKPFTLPATEADESEEGDL